MTEDQEQELIELQRMIAGRLLAIMIQVSWAVGVLTVAAFSR